MFVGILAMATFLPREKVDTYWRAKKPYSELLAKVVEDMYAKTAEERLAEHRMDPPVEPNQGDASTSNILKTKTPFPTAAAKAAAGPAIDVEETVEAVRNLRISAEKGKDKGQKESWAKIDQLLGNKKRGK